MQPWITELTPLSFMRRSVEAFPDKPAVVHGPTCWTYRELEAATERRARMLRVAGVSPGERVAYLMPNVPEMLAAHFAVPLAGGILVAINTRLAPDEVRWILNHSGATVLVVDAEYAGTIAAIADSLETVETIAVSHDPHGPGPSAELPGAWALEDLLAEVDHEHDDELVWAVEDERATIAINYTSGTTGRPKGVMYTHRGAYLNSFGEIFHSDHDVNSVYLWTLPMFHCNGWCTVWALVAVGGTQICLREVRGEAVWELIDQHRVTHLNGAPAVVTAIMNSEKAHTLEHALVVTNGGAPPSPSTLLEMEAMGFTIVHVYGLTETYGPYATCQWQEDWRALDPQQRAQMQSRQGIGMVQADRVRVVEQTRPRQLVDVPADGQTMGEIVMRGNNVMKGYYRDPEATADAFAGGWFHSGDLGVVHLDGYIELRDRAKDVIISGGENISTVEVEHAVASHPDVLEVAIVGVPDSRWSERPKAFVVARPGRSVTETDVLAHVRARIAHYKAPREIELVDALPKTATGKVQKFELRHKERADTNT